MIIDLPSPCFINDAIISGKSSSISLVSVLPVSGLDNPSAAKAFYQLYAVRRNPIPENGVSNVRVSWGVNQGNVPFQCIVVGRNAAIIIRQICPS